MRADPPETGYPRHSGATKLCVIGRADSPHTRRWIAPLAARDHEMHLIHVGPSPAASAWPEAQLVDLPARFNRRWLRYPVWVAQTRRILQSVRPHVLHAHCLDLSGWVAAATRYRPLVVTVWGSDVLLHPRRSPAARALARWVLRRADVVTAPAPVLAERAAELSGRSDNIRVIPWGVDCRVFAPDGDRNATLHSLGIDPEIPLILSPRGFHPLYDPERILAAMARVVRLIPKAMLLAVDLQAEPTRRLEVERKIRDLNLSGNVRILPAVHEPWEMADLYTAASIVISYAQSDSLSLTVLEAMASSTPVVVGDLPAYRDWIDDEVGGVRIPLGDSKAMADAILSLLKSPMKSLEMGHRARQEVCRRASIEQQLERSVELYSELTGRRRTTGSC